MRRSAPTTLALLGALLVAGETRANEGAASATIPARFVRGRPTIESLKTGESARVPPTGFFVQPDGTAWLRLSTSLARQETCDPSVSPKLTKVADGVFDVDLTGCDCRWALGNDDGTPFEASREHVRVRHFTKAGAKPSAVLPETARGERLWSLPPETTVYVGAHAVGVDVRGEAWIDPRAACSRTRFTDGRGPAVAATTSFRDVVKLDLTGVTWRFRVEHHPPRRPLWPGGALNGHSDLPFAVTSISRGRAVYGRMPAECMEPLLKDVKFGEGGFVEPLSVRRDSRGTAWVPDVVTVSAAPRFDDWGFAYVKVKVIDALTCTLELSRTTCRWPLADSRGVPFPDTAQEDGNFALDRKWLRVSEVLDDGAIIGKTLPERCRAERVFEVPAGTTAYASCRFLHVDVERRGFVSGATPVSRAPFADELGPAFAVTPGPEEASCAVDLRGVTARFDLTPAPALGPVERPTKGGPRQKWLKVTQFTTDEPK